jgi:hypothetical protein
MDLSSGRIGTEEQAMVFNYAGGRSNDPAYLVNVIASAVARRLPAAAGTGFAATSADQGRIDAVADAIASRLGGQVGTDQSRQSGDSWASSAVIDAIASAVARRLSAQPATAQGQLPRNAFITDAPLVVDAIASALVRRLSGTASVTPGASLPENAESPDLSDLQQEDQTD